MRGITAAGGRVYVGIEQFLPDSRRLGYVYALDSVSGETVWRRIVPRHGGVRSNVTGAPTVAGNLVLGADIFSNSVFALDAATGDSVWTWRGPLGWTGPTTSPSVQSDVAYVGSGDTHVYALALATGAVIWSRGLESSVNQAVPCGDRVLAHRDHLDLLDLESGAPLKTVVGGNDFVVTQIGVDGDEAYFGTYGRLIALKCD